MKLVKFAIVAVLWAVTIYVGCLIGAAYSVIDWR